MNKTKFLTISALPVLLAAGALWARGLGEDGGGLPYRFARVEKADVQSTVAATGSLSAVTTVQVGTQVSGQVSAIYVDFNDLVREGQLLARIDPTLLQQSVREAEASLARGKAEAERARREYDRGEKLAEGQVITDAELSDLIYNLQVAQANLRSAEIALERASRNLDYTEIHAPIDGIVVERNVDVGQTVAASLAAPQLFLIAQDLSEMQILAAVDESDIGLIHQGQEVEFTVQAYPDETFGGTVEQVRLQSTTNENVVTYTVVVSVENPDGRLLPGMTATVDFVIGSTSDAFVVPNAALRFRPTEQMLEAAGKAAPATSVLWTVEGSRPTTVPIEIGLSDGQRTAVSGEGLRPGMQVIVGTTEGTSAATSGLANPLQQSNGAGGPPPPGGF